MPRPRSARATGASLLLAVGCAALGLAACSRHRGVEREGDPGTTALTGADVPPRAAAVSALVDARCAHEAACDGIGVGRRFTTGSACLSMLRDDTNEDLTECPRGVDTKRLDACVARIRAQPCNSPVAELESLRSCRMSALCLRPPIVPSGKAP